MTALGSDNRLDAPLIDAVGVQSQPTPNAGYTVEPDEPDGYGDLLTWGYRSAWWRVKVPETQWITIGTEGTTGLYPASSNWLYLAVYWMDPDTQTLTIIKQESGDGNTAGWGFPQVTFKAGMNATYWVQLFVDLDADVTYLLSTAASDPIPRAPTVYTTDSTPGSNLFANAPERLEGTASSTTNDTGFILETGEPILDYRETASMWWKFTPTWTGLFRFASSGGVLGIFTGTSVDNLTLVDARGNSGTIYLWHHLQEGVTYHIRLSRINSTPRNAFMNIYTGTPVGTIEFGAESIVQHDAAAAGELVGGQDAMVDGSDSTYIHHYANTFWHFTFPATPLPGTMIDLKLVVRGYVAEGGPFQTYRSGPDLNFSDVNGNGASYSPMTWAWPPDDVYVEKSISLRNFNDSPIMTKEMVETGDMGWYGGEAYTAWSNGGADWSAYISELGFRAYMFVDTYPVEPPDQDVAAPVIELGPPTARRRFIAARW